MSDGVVITAINLELAGSSLQSLVEQEVGAALGPFRIERLEEAGCSVSDSTERGRHTPVSARLRDGMRRLFDAAGLDGQTVAGPATGLVSGSRYGCSEVYDLHRRLRQHGPRGIDAVGFAQATHNYPVSACAIEFGLRGPCAAIVSSTSAGLEALTCAHDWLLEKRCERVIVAGYEDLRGVAADHLHFTARDGEVAREAMALVCLERSDAARGRDAPILAEIKGISMFPPPTTGHGGGAVTGTTHGGRHSPCSTALNGFETGQMAGAATCLGASGLVQIILGLLQPLGEPRDSDWVVGAANPAPGGIAVTLRPAHTDREIAA